MFSPLLVFLFVSRFVWLKVINVDEVEEMFGHDNQGAMGVFIFGIGLLNMIFSLPIALLILPFFIVWIIFMIIMTVVVKFRCFCCD